MWVKISLEKGGQGGYPRVTTARCAVPGRLSSAELPLRPNVPAMPFNPPCPPFSRLIFTHNYSRSFFPAWKPATSKVRS